MLESFKARVRPTYHRWRSQSLGLELALQRQSTVSPTHIALSTRNWISKQGSSAARAAGYQEIIPRTLVPVIPAQTTAPSSFQLDPRKWNPPAFVVRMEMAQIIGQGGDVLASDGTWLTELSSWRNDLLYLERQWHPVFMGTLLEPPIRLTGRTCLISALWASGNYFHWLYNVIPRLELVRRAGIAIQHFEHILVNHMAFPVQHESLLTFGIAQSQIVELDDTSWIQADRLVTTSSLLQPAQTSPWVIELLRNLYLPLSAQVRKPERRIFISRGDTALRRIVNESDCLEILSAAGFERIELLGKTLAEQAELFASANVIVLTNGAASANLAFCAPGTRVIALHHPDQDTNYSLQVSACAKLDYYYVQGISAPPAPGQPETYSYSISPQHLSDTLKLAKVPIK